MDSEDDQYLLHLAVAGDRDALETLLQEAEPRLRAYAERRMPSTIRLTAAPDDVLQDTWIEAIRLIGGFEPRGIRLFQAWLFRILRYRIQLAVQKHVTRVKHGTVGGFDSDASIAGAIQELAVYRRTPSKSAAGHEFMAAVERSLAKLPAHYREVVTLRHIEGFSVEETATRMGRDRAAVSVLTCRALAALREQLVSESRFA